MKDDFSQKIVQGLTQAKQRSRTIIGDRELAVIDFLNGFYSALSLLGYEVPVGDDELLKNILTERGWDSDSPAGPWHEMYSKGFSSQEITDELLKIHIKYWENK